MPKLKSLLIIVALIASLGLVACGGSDEPKSNPGGLTAEAKKNPPADGGGLEIPGPTPAPTQPEEPNDPSETPEGAYENCGTLPAPGDAEVEVVAAGMTCEESLSIMGAWGEYVAANAPAGATEFNDETTYDGHFYNCEAQETAAGEYTFACQDSDDPSRVSGAQLRQ